MANTAALPRPRPGAFDDEEQRAKSAAPARRRGPAALWAIAVPLFVLYFSYAMFKADRVALTHDEAFTYNAYASRPVERIVRDYGLPNNHILHTLAAHFSTAAFGSGRFAVRLPALLFGLAWMGALAMLGRKLAGEIGIFLPLAALTFTGFFDYQVMARGYSLGGLALTLGLSILISERVRFLKSQGLAILAGAFLGASLAAVPTMGLGVVPVAVAWGLVVLFRRPARLLKELWFSALISLAGGGVFWLVFRHIDIQPKSWPWGYNSLWLLFENFWLHIAHVSSPLELCASAGVVVCWGIAFVSAIRSRREEELICLLVLPFTILMLAGTRALGLLVPFERAISFLVPFLLLPIFLVGARARGRLRDAFYTAAGLGFAVMLAHFVKQEEPDLLTKRIQDAASAEASVWLMREAAKPGKVGAYWEVVPTVTHELLRKPGLSIADVGTVEYYVGYPAADPARCIAAVLLYTSPRGATVYRCGAE